MTERNKKVEKEMKKTYVTLKAWVVVMEIIVLGASPGVVSADAHNTNQTDYWTNYYGLSTEELGAGATPLTGTISVADYHARQAIVQSSLVALDLDLNPIK
jgi:hypothetical protein